MSKCLQPQDERDGLQASAAIAHAGGPEAEARQQEREELVVTLCRCVQLGLPTESGFTSLATLLCSAS